MLKTFLAAFIIIGAAVFGMCFNIIFRKDGEFPEYEVGSNRKLREKGIRCMHEEEVEMRRKKKATTKKTNCNESCSNCRETECR